MLGPGAAALDLAEWRSGPAGRNKARRQFLKFCLSTTHDKLFSGVTHRAERNNTSRLFLLSAIEGSYSSPSCFKIY